MNILFVCSRNKWRSRTAETIFKNAPYHQVQSAGTEASARIKLTERMLQWADQILVMEKQHRERIVQCFGNGYTPRIVVLDIADDYEYMDETLIELLREAVGPYLE